MKHDVEPLLKAFEAAQTMKERQDALRELMKRRAVDGAKSDTRFLTGIARSLAVATEEAGGERLLAIAILGRIAAVVKSMRDDIDRGIANALASPIPPLSELGDADDRHYVAKALHAVRAEWVSDYLAASIISEEFGEKVREELADALLSRAPNISTALSKLVGPLRQFCPETESPGDSVGKRLKRIIAALRPKMVGALAEPGDDLGGRLRDVFLAAFHGTRAPESLAVAEEAAEEAAGLVHDLVRTQFTLVTDASVYASLEVPRSWFPKGFWPRFAGKSPAVALIKKDISDAISLLAKQSVTDPALLEQLAALVGSKEEAAKITTQIAEKHPEFDAEVREWLRLGGRIRLRSGSALLEESRELSADPLLAGAMLDAERVKEGMAAISEDIIGELRVFEPALGANVNTLISRSNALIQAVQRLADKRGLRVRGRPGEVVEYAPIAHELTGGHKAGIRWVRIVWPLVERLTPGGAGEVILKAVVEENKP